MVIALVVIILILIVALIPVQYDKPKGPMPNFKIGDIVLTDGNHFGGSVTRALTMSKYSHWGIINRIDANGEPYVVHCSPAMIDRGICDVREDRLFGPYFGVWNQAIYVMSRRNAPPFAPVDVKDYARVTYRYFNPDGVKTHNCISLAAHILRRNGIDIRDRWVFFGRFNSIIKGLVRAEQFYNPQLIHSRMSTVNMQYIRKWFYASPEPFAAANAEVGDVPAPFRSYRSTTARWP